MRNNLSAILNYQLPEFVREDHQVFVAFLQAYFEHLEETGSTLDFLHRYKANQDIYQADDQFVEAFYTELAGTFKKDPLVDKNRLVNHIKDFYLAKGAEQSFQFIFTVLYNEKVEVEYPRIYMAKPSAGVYKSENMVFTTAENLGRVFFDNNELTSFVEGITSGAMAVVDTIEPLTQGGQDIYRIKLSSFDKHFDIGEDVKITINDQVIYETVLPSINGVNIIDAGTNYTIGDTITVNSPGDGDYARLVIDQVSKGGYTKWYRNDDPNQPIGPSYPTGTNYAVGDLIYADPVPGSLGHSFSAEVAAVDGGGAITAIRVYDNGYEYTGKTTATVVSENGIDADITLDGNLGAIQSILVPDSGFNYPETATLSVSGGDGNFNGEIVFDSIYRQPEKYLSIRNHPSSVSKLQDSFFYQQFSYTVGSFVKPGEYYDMLINNVHPVGAQMFPLWKLEDFQDISIELATGSTEGCAMTTVLTQIGTDSGQGDINTEIDLVGECNTTVKKSEPEIACEMGTTFWDFDNTKFFDTFNYTVGDFLEVQFKDFEFPGCRIYTIIEESPDTDITFEASSNPFVKLRLYYHRADVTAY